MVTKWRHRLARGPALRVGPDPWRPPRGVAGRNLAPHLPPCSLTASFPARATGLGLLIQQPPVFLVPGSPYGLLEAFGFRREFVRASAHGPLGAQHWEDPGALSSTVHGPLSGPLGLLVWLSTVGLPTAAELP